MFTYFSASLLRLLIQLVDIQREACRAEADKQYEQVLCVHGLKLYEFLVVAQFWEAFAFFTTGRSEGCART